MDYNRVILAGRLTRDPEQRTLPNGTVVAGAGLAVNRKWAQDGEQREEVLFIDLDAFGKTAEGLVKFFRKGNKILVEGRLKLDSWEKDGEKKSKIKCVVDAWKFVESKGGEQHQEGTGERGGGSYRSENPPARRRSAQPAAAPAPAPSDGLPGNPSDEDPEADLPF